MSIDDNNVAVNYSLLLIGNNPRHQRLLERVLAEKRGDGNLPQADTLDAGISFLQKNSVDLVLLSHHEGNDLESLQKLNSKFHQIPIIIVSDEVDEHAALESIQQGAQEYLCIKDLDAQSIIHTIELAIARQKFYMQEGQLQKNYDLAENSFHMLVDSSADGIIVVDNDGIILFLNHAAEELFGWSAESLIGGYLGSPIVAGGSAEIEINNPNNKSGEITVAEMRAEITVWDGAYANVVAMRDITIRKRMENNLFEAKLAAEVANRAKSEFLANMSHEIRTPMYGVIGMLELLDDTHLEAKQKRYVDTASESASSLVTIINDILDLSKIEAGHLALENIPFDLRKTVENTVASCAKLATEKGLELNCFIHTNIPSHVSGDSGRLRQVLINLLNNAIKFTHEGQVNLRVNLQEQSDDHTLLRFEVKDTGIGIPVEKQTGLFNAFAQADNSTTRKFGGTGLGLTISKQLSELMGGEIGVISAEGQGSTFWFNTQFEKTEQLVQDSNDLPEDLHFNNICVLLVDDMLTNQIVGMEMLKKLGAQVEIAEDGQQAIDAFNRNQYDIVLMDCQMPVMDGYAATEVIRAQEQTRGLPHLPIVALTAHAMQDNQEACLAAGMDDYLTKPLSGKDLKAMLLRWLPDNVKTTTNKAVIPEKDSPNDAVQLAELMDSPLFDNSQLEGLCALAGNNLDVIFNAFEMDASSILPQLIEAATTENLKNIRYCAHSIKGFSAGIGAMQLSKLCYELEKQASSGQLQNLSQQVESIISVYNDTLDALKTI